VKHPPLGPGIPRRISMPRTMRAIAAIGTASAIASVIGLLLRVPSWGVVALPIALLFAGPAWLMARATVMRVRISSDRLRVHNWLHTYDLRWDQIDGVDVIAQSTGIGSYAQIRRAGGRPITLGVSVFDVRGSRVVADRVAAPIRAALDRAHGQA
jgi:hypothetical protein